MAQNFEFRDRIPAAADAVLAKMLDTAFLAEWTKVQKGVNPVVKIVEQSDAEALITIDLEEPLPKPLGNIKAHMSFRWDLINKTMDWTREAEGSMASKAKVSGTTKIESTGDETCELVEIINISIPVPMVGKKMEQQVASYLKGGRSEKIDYLIRHL